MNDVAHARVDLLIPLAAAEHPLVAHAGLYMVRSLVRSHTCAQFQCGHGLANGTNSVALALDRHERRAPGCGRMDLTSASMKFAPRHSTSLEHVLRRLLIELGGQVLDGKVLVVQVPNGLGLVLVSFDQVLVEVVKGFFVLIQVHIQKS